jgi:hypothetical protein
MRKPLTRHNFAPDPFKFPIFFNSAYNHPAIQTVQEGIHPEHLPESALRLRQSETWNSFDLYTEQYTAMQSHSHIAQEWHFCNRIVSRSWGIKGTVAKYFLLTNKWYLGNCLNLFLTEPNLGGFSVLSDSCPAFFLPIATTSNKNF